MNKWKEFIDPRNTITLCRQIDGRNQVIFVSYNHPRKLYAGDGADFALVDTYKEGIEWCENRHNYKKKYKYKELL